MSLMFLPVLAFTQSKKNPQADRIESQKVAFLTKEMDLTSEESQKFWPVYNQFNKERQEIRKQMKEALKPGKPIEECSDAELQKIMENTMSNKQKELDLEKQYHTKFLAVLPVKKVAKLYMAEEKFKRMLLERMSENKGKHGPKGKPGPPDDRPGGPPDDMLPDNE